MAAEVQHEPHATDVPVIKKLDESVVNRIAAGEVIQRPASALKEMLENSLDAGSTAITVMVKEGGNKMLQIQDNGHGIRKEDMPILCERFTTSKLRAFEDLQGIQTLGFRGEALASISYVAHITVTTMTADSNVAYRATYADGVMNEGCPKPCASTKGTIILVEDLFFNVPLRKKALKSSSEEYNHILDVMGRYAVYRAGVAMICKRQGEARADLCTLQGGTQLDALRAVYGAGLARNVMPLALKQEADPSAEGGDGGVSFEIEGYVSGADYSGKKTVLVLFINGRCVECSPLKRALEATYAMVLPKAAKPFIFLDVRLPGSHVDVNVHPTKREVGFLHQEELIEAIRAGVEERLLCSNSRRTYNQTMLPGAPLIEVPTNTPPPPYYRPDKLVRTDAKAQTLHAFLPSGSQQQRAQQAQRDDAQRAQELDPGQSADPGQQHQSLGMDFQGDAIEGSSGMELDAGQMQGQQQGGLQEANGEGASEPGLGSSKAAAVAAVAALPVARRRKGEGGLLGDGASGGAFDFMPTPMEISGAVPSASGNLLATELPSGEVLEGREEEGPLGGAAPQLHVDSQNQQGGKRVAGVVRHRANPASSSGLESVQRLLAEAEKHPHAGLSEILRSLTFVGMADEGFALIQHGTRLYLMDVQALSHDMFYQQALRRVGHCRRIRLEPAPSIADLAVAELEALEAAGKWQDSKANGTKQEVAALLTELLHKKSAWLAQHFSIDVDADGRLCSLPQLIEQWAPDVCRLPAFVLALARKVEWGHEQECFRTLALALADLYCTQPLLPNMPPANKQLQSSAAVTKNQMGDESIMQREDEAATPEDEEERRAREWSVQHVILPALRLFLRPGRTRARDGSIVELTRLENLYRIFERC